MFADDGASRRKDSMTGDNGKRQLPSIPHPDHLRKQAKARLAAMRTKMPTARLADAQGVIARE